MSDWYSDEQLWQEFAPYMFNGRRLNGTAREVDSVVKLLDLQPGATVVDLCCGPGRHSLELARRGFKVTGVDLNRAYVKQARKAVAAEKLDVEFVEANVLEFSRKGAFDAAIIMYSSFGYFEEIADDRRLLANISASLRPHGAVLIDTMGKEPSSRRFFERAWHRPDDFPEDVFIVENRVVGAWERLELKWTVVKPDGARKNAIMNIRLYSALEMASLLRDAGFDKIGAYGDLSGAAYDQNATVLVAVGRK